jgi:hypothetical protein
MAESITVRADSSAYVRASRLMANWMAARVEKPFQRIGEFV